MIQAIKLLGYTILLNVIRYYPGSWIEMMTIFDQMHKPMEDNPDCFGFTDADFPSSLFYNFVMWWVVIIAFHVTHKAINASYFIKSLVIFGLFGIFFVSLSAIYMNHFNQDIRTFFRYGMVDGLMLFSFLGFVNGLIYPRIFPSKPR